MPGQGVCLHVLGARTIEEDEVKPDEKQGPTGLSGSQAFGGLEIFQVLMVSDDLERLLSSFKPVAPLLQSKFYGKQFTVPDGVVPLGWG